MNGRKNYQKKFLAENIESTSRKFDLHKIPFIYTSFPHYFMLIGNNEDKSYKFIENEKIKEKKLY